MAQISVTHHGDLPHTRVLATDTWPDEGTLMQFRLLFDGRLPTQSAQNSRTKEKHAIRQEFHPQLAALWNSNRFLYQYIERVINDPDAPGGYARHIDHIGKRYARCGHHFVPLVSDFFGGGPQMLACSLDILFLRADQPPGDLVLDGGDIDNRIKVLLDALQIPTNCKDIPATPPVDQDPFFCLLEDDRMITELKVTTDRLLIPSEPALKHPEQQVRLIIHVRTQVRHAARASS